MGLQGLDRLGQPSRKPYVVGIQEGHELTPRTVDAVVARRGEAAIVFNADDVYAVAVSG